jgi:hypothetical protein
MYFKHEHRVWIIIYHDDFNSHNNKETAITKSIIEIYLFRKIRYKVIGYI